jgi:hypothetical protein
MSKRPPHHRQSTCQIFSLGSSIGRKEENLTHMAAVGHEAIITQHIYQGLFTPENAVLLIGISGFGECAGHYIRIFIVGKRVWVN